MKNLSWVIPLLFCGTLNAQIYQGSTIYGSKVSRFKPELVLHIPTSSDTLIRTIDPSPQIRIINGVLKLWLNNRWNDISAGSVSSGTGTGTVPAWGSVTGYLPDQTDLAAALASKASVSTLSQYLLNSTAQAIYATIGALDTLKNTPYNLRTDRTLRVVSGDTVLGVNTDTIPTKLWVLANTGSGGNTNAVWGGITGTLINQTDLKNALDLKADISAIPTNNTQLANGAGYITNSALSPYITTSTATATYQPKITLTTTGNSGIATLVGATLNIPNYGAATGTSTQVTSYQTATATAGQASFTFSGVPVTKSDYWIDIWGVVVPQASYSQSGNTITFTSGLALGSPVTIHQVK